MIGFRHYTLVAAVLLLMCSAARAQQGVCVYKDSDFEGPRRCFENDVKNFGDLGINDQISSFQIHGNVDVIFYEHSRHRGANRQFSQERAVLIDGMNDNFSSMKIVKSKNSAQWGDRGRWGYDSNDTPVNDWTDDNNDYVDDKKGLACLYPDRNYRGQEFCFTHDDPRFEIFGFDNKADSLRLEGDIEVELFQHADYKGFSRVFRQSVPRFQDYEHDQYSAIRIRKRSRKNNDLKQPVAEVCLYPNKNYKGQARCFNNNNRRFADFGFDNKADSIRIKGNVEVILFQHENYTGFSRVFRNSVPQFKRGDSDQFSSIKIRRH